VRLFRVSAIVLVLLILTSVEVKGQGRSGFASKRLNALLERHGWIRIGIEDSTSQASVNAPAGASLQLDQKLVTCSAGEISFSVSGGGVLVGIPGQGSATAKEVLVASNGDFLRYNGRAYRGKFRIIAGHSLRVINEVMIDDWLKGVLPAEIGSDSPVEALKAQAVAARSEAIFRLAHPPHSSEGYDFCTGVHCQAYKGIGEETPQIQRACDETLGYVLVAGDDVLNAVYHNVCGGVTAGAEEVWDSDPIPGLTPVFDNQKGGVVDLSSEAAVRRFIEEPGTDYFCYPGNPEYASYAKKYFRWSKTLSASEIASATGVGTLTDIQVTQRMRSGRIRKLTVTGTGGSKTLDKELNIRHAFDLWSGLFVMDIDRSGTGITSVTFKGAGNGHGVGLCQHGAREIARRGGTFDQILGHYYPGAKLRKIYRP
jgi:SpoIID/LytB domain protein